MTAPERRRHRPDGWTFVPLLTAVFIIVSFIVVYGAFVVCSERDGAACDAVPVVPLLKEFGVCGYPAWGEAAAQSPAAAQSSTPTRTQRQAAAYVSRMVWMLLFALSVLSVLVALFTSGRFIWQSLRDSFRARGRWLFLVVVAGVSLLAVCVLRRPAQGNMPVFESLVACVTEADAMTRAPALARFSIDQGLFIAFVLVLTSCVILWPVRKTPRDSVGVLIERMRYLRVLLYAGMVVLVVSVLRLDAMLRWTLSTLSEDEEAVKQLKAITASVVSVEAVAYTLLLAAIYVPAFLVLRYRAKSLITPGPGYTPAMGDEWLEQHGLDVTATWKKFWPKLVAILAPLLAGPVGDLLEKLSK